MREGREEREERQSKEQRGQEVKRGAARSPGRASAHRSQEEEGDM